MKRFRTCLFVCSTYTQIKTSAEWNKLVNSYFGGEFSSEPIYHAAEWDGFAPLECDFCGNQRRPSLSNKISPE